MRHEFTSLELETALAGNDPVASQSAFESILGQKVDPIPFLVPVLESLDQEYLSFPLSFGGGLSCNITVRKMGQVNALQSLYIPSVLVIRTLSPNGLDCLRSQLSRVFPRW